MKHILYKVAALAVMVVLTITKTTAQCAICTKTAQQLGEGPAKGLNAAILYLMLIPLALLFFIGYKWYKREKSVNRHDNHF